VQRIDKIRLDDLIVTDSIEYAKREEKEKWRDGWKEGGKEGRKERQRGVMLNKIMDHFLSYTHQSFY
jgi:hypothetical protein